MSGRGTMSHAEAMAEARRRWGADAHVWRVYVGTFAVGKVDPERRRSKFDSKNLSKFASGDSYADAFARFDVEKWAVERYGLNVQVERSYVPGERPCRVYTVSHNHAFAPNGRHESEIASGDNWTEVLAKCRAAATAPPGDSAP